MVNSYIAHFIYKGYHLPLLRCPDDPRCPDSSVVGLPGGLLLLDKQLSNRITRFLFNTVQITILPLLLQRRRRPDDPRCPDSSVVGVPGGLLLLNKQLEIRISNPLLGTIQITILPLLLQQRRRPDDPRCPDSSVVGVPGGLLLLNKQLEIRINNSLLGIIQITILPLSQLRRRLPDDPRCPDFSVVGLPGGLLLLSPMAPRDGPPDHAWRTKNKEYPLNNDVASKQCLTKPH
jgi:hypothetical protein